MYFNPINDTKNSISALLKAAIEKCGYPLPAAGIEVSPTKDSTHGDYASNCAMQLAGVLRQNPRAVAASICENLLLEGSVCEKVEIAGPGFINFFLSDRYFADVVRAAATAGDDYGKNDFGGGKKVMVEFVSANPTGPMHMGNARGGAVGDALASVLERSGYNVAREFYVNDAGNQVDNLAKSLYTRYYEIINGEGSIEFPEDGYHGDDVKVFAKAYFDEKGDVLSTLSPDEIKSEMVTKALAVNIDKMKANLEKYRITYDVWFFESLLHTSGYVAETIDILRSKGALYDNAGAVWFKATDYGCEKDEVLVKANGFYTYYAVDLAYHRNKFEKRGFDEVIDVLGADHHGHTLRYKAGLAALGLDASSLKVVLIQLVRLLKDGEVFKMSKRTGKAVSLSDLLDEIPVDAARFFFNYKQSESSMDFDLSLAVQQNSDNPVYYVQYAHARICSIIKNIEAEGVAILPVDKVDLSLLKTAEERELISFIAAFPNEVLTAATTMDPTRISRYCISVAGAFHKFYNCCHVRCEDDALMQARLTLCNAAKVVIKNCLDIIKVSAPEKM